MSDTAKQTQKKPKPPKKITEKYLTNAGLHYLKRYTASVNHFKRVMNRKIKKSLAHHKEPSFEECQHILESVIKTLIEQGYLNDENYAYGMVTSYRRRGLSKRGILSKLGQKGLDTELITEALNRIDDQTEHISLGQSAELTAAIKHAQKKRLGPYSRKAEYDEKDQQRALGSLARAGFSYDVAKRALEEPENEI